MIIINNYLGTRSCKYYRRVLGRNIYIIKDKFCYYFVMDWLGEELSNDLLRMSTEGVSIGCVNGARPTYGPPSSYSLIIISNRKRTASSLLSSLRDIYFNFYISRVSVLRS